jgi:hypothetical protein
MRSTSTNFGAPGTSYPMADASGDPFLKEDVQDLAAAVDDHDHSAGRGPAVQRLGTGIVEEANLANDAVTFDKLADHASTNSLRAVGANHIRDDAVITRTILDGAVTAVKLGIGAWSGLAFPRVYGGYTVNSQTPGSGGAVTPVSFTAADVYDTMSGHSPSVNPTRFTITEAGWYLLFGFAKFAANATGTRELYFALTRSAVTTYLQSADSRPAQATQPIIISVAAPYQLEVGDYLELGVWQNSGSGLILQDAGFGITAFGS